jgi:hypothetical protein
MGTPATPGIDSRSEQAYQQILNRWTRRAEIYNGFESQVFLAGTIQSLSFRKARIKRVARFLAMSPAEIEKAWEKEREEYFENVEILIAVYVSERRFDDFSHPDSIWRIVLETENGVVFPSSVKRFRRPTVTMRILYPYIDEFWSVYRIGFSWPFTEKQKVPAELGRIMVRFSSSLGKMDLVYD